MSTETDYTLDPVTFEVLKNAFVTIVDEMAEQILRTCYSFVIYCARLLLGALRRARATRSCRAGRTSPSTSARCTSRPRPSSRRSATTSTPATCSRSTTPTCGGTHFNDVRIIRPIFHDGELIAFSQSNGHWADVGGSVPGSFDVNAKEHFGEGLRIPPVRIWDKGRYLADVVELIVSNTRAPQRRRGRPARPGGGDAGRRARDPAAVEKYGGDTIVTAFDEVQDYVERLTRQRVGRAARRHLGDRGLHRLRPRRGRGPGPDQGQADDRGRPDPLRPVGLAPGGRARSSTRASARRSRASSPARRRSSPTSR